MLSTSSQGKRNTLTLQLVAVLSVICVRCVKTNLGNLMVCSGWNTSPMQYHGISDLYTVRAAQMMMGSQSHAYPHQGIVEHVPSSQ